jgi:hypothetical protein
MTTENPPEPPQVVAQVEEYVDTERRDAERYENREPFDKSGVFALHRLASRIYAAGHAAGEYAQSERNRHQAMRDAEARRVDDL